MELAERQQATEKSVRLALPGHAPGTFLAFMVVGALAFVVNYAAFFLLYDSPLGGVLPAKDSDVDLGLFTHPDIRLLIASVLAVEVAIVSKFFVHERWTFRGRPREGQLWWRFLQFDVSATIAAAAPIATVNVLSASLGVSPYVAMFLGVMIGFGLNWFWSSRLIWPARHTEAGD